MTVRSAALIAVVVSAGCVAATPYQRMAGDGGYEDFPKDAATYVVTFRGNEATSREQVAMYLHYRCAELTVQSGQQFFTVVSSESKDLTDQWSTPGYATTTTTGAPYSRYGSRDRTTTYTPPQTVTYVRPVLTATIRLSSGAKPEGGFDAREVLQLLAPRVGVAPLAPATAPAP